MNTKLYKTLFTLPVVALLTTGCEDFMDTAPMGSTVTSDQKEETVAADPSRIEASVAAISANFLQFGGVYTDESVHSDIGYPCIMLTTDSRTADMVADPVGYNWFSDGLLYDDSQPTSRSITLMWNTLYNQIYTANNVIGLVDPETEDASSQFYLAQALAIRAFDYFTMVQLFQANYQGHEDALGVPLITDENKDEVAAAGLARSTVRETYEFILNDLNRAIELLQASGMARPDKRYVSLDVVYGIRARVYLTMHDYEAALADAETALASTSATPYSMTEVGRPSFIDIDDNSWMWGILVTEQDRCSTSGICNFPSHMGSLNYGYASVGAWRRVSTTLYNAIPETDIRKGWFLDGEGVSANLPAAAQEYITGAHAPVYTDRLMNLAVSGVLDPVLGHHEHRLPLRQIGGIDEPGDPLSGLALSQVDPEGGRVSHDMASDGPGGVAEERIGLCRDLVGHGDDRVVDGGEVQQVVHMAVEDLLPLGQRAAADVLRTEVGG